MCCWKSSALRNRHLKATRAQEGEYPPQQEYEEPRKPLHPMLFATAIAAALALLAAGVLVLQYEVYVQDAVLREAYEIVGVDVPRYKALDKIDIGNPSVDERFGAPEQLVVSLDLTNTAPLYQRFPTLAVQFPSRGRGLAGRTTCRTGGVPAEPDAVASHVAAPDHHGSAAPRRPLAGRFRLLDLAAMTHAGALVTVERALLSVSDKTGIVEFGRALEGMGVELVSTGGTFAVLSDAGVSVTEVATVTGFPEMMDGRVKTLHPMIHGGILARRDVDAETLTRHGIGGIDLVAVNLYPFEATVAQS